MMNEILCFILGHKPYRIERTLYVVCERCPRAVRWVD